MTRLIIFLCAAIALAGCSSTKQSTFPGKPHMSLVGEGLQIDRAALPVAYKPPERRTANSLWTQSNQGLFQDRRARQVGDILTIRIDIDDQAQFDNTSGRSKEGDAKGSLAATLGFGGLGLGSQEAEANANLDSKLSTSAQGKGSIDRSEKLRLSIAAIVTEVLPDGNLVITGTQEVRVNREVRVLNIAGIVNPLDIGSNNRIPYDKIAEARISYGGRGKISAVQ